MDTLRLYFVTWNVATRPPEQDMNSLLDFPSQFNKNKPIPDFFVIGLQEVKSQPQNILMDSLFTDPWTSTFNKILCRHNYIIAKSIRLQGLLLMVYTKMSHLTHLRDIEAQYTKTGLGGIWGNKGAVSVRFNIYGCSVCFVNSHLTAHEHLLTDRINDYNTIIKQHNYHVKETSNILYHDYVFWLGDLNFRTDHQQDGKSLTSEEIVANLKKIEKDKYQSILKYDQLMAVMKSEEAFSEFTEPEIKFPPTYKYFIGSDEYDVKRKPSWTDRILYKVIPNNYENVTLRADLISYQHLPHYTVSDHKPVIAQYTIKTCFAPRSPAAPKLSLSQVTLRSATIVSETDVVEETSAVRTSEEDLKESEYDLDETSLNHAFYSACCINVLRDKVFSDYTEKTAEFAPITRIWYVGDADFRTQCTLSGDVEIHPNDWIGIYDANFQSLDDYIAYEYLAKVKLPQSPGIPGEPRTITLSFPVGSGVRIPGFYRFIYLSQPNSDIRSVLGISEPFEVSSKEDRLISLNSNSGPSCSRAPVLFHKTSTTTTDIFSDFTGLDVGNLSRHFSNDLSFD